MFPKQLPDTWSARLRTLDTILAEWFPSPASAGLPAAEIQQAEKKLGLRFPRALREWYTTFGARSDVWCAQDALFAPSEIRVQNDVVLFAAEAQTCWYWGIPLTEFGTEDPPVLISTSGSAMTWEHESDSVSRFALQYAMLSLKISGSPPYKADGPLNPPAKAAFVEKYARLPFGELHAPVYPTEFYGSDEIVLEVEADVWLWLVSKTRAAIETCDAIAREHGMAWEHLTL